MYKNSILKRLINLPRPIGYLRFRSNEVNIEKLELESGVVDVEAIDEEAAAKEERIQKSRNKSRLQKGHRNILHNKVPYEEPTHWSHLTLKYNRKLYGKYGFDSKFNAALCWPTKDELDLSRERERVTHPYTIQEMAEMARQNRVEREKWIENKMEDINKKLAKVEMWKKELKDKMEKKEADALAAKSRKDKLIEEVRRHFGFTVDPRDDRFKELLEKKEKEQKKAMKEAKKKAKEEKMIAILTKQQQETPPVSEDSKETTKVE